MIMIMMMRAMMMMVMMMIYNTRKDVDAVGRRFEPHPHRRWLRWGKGRRSTNRRDFTKPLRPNRRGVTTSA